MTEISVIKAVGNLERMQEILYSDENEAKKVTKLREIYPTYKEFRTTFFRRPRNSSRKTKLINDNYIVKGAFTQDDEYFIRTIDKLLSKYEGFETGLEIVKKSELKISSTDTEEEKNAKRLARAKELVRGFVEASTNEKFTPIRFFNANKTDEVKFGSYVRLVEENDPELYELYRKATSAKLRNVFAEPIGKINKILMGINTGLNEEGNEFTTLDFYKLAPYRGQVVGDAKDLDGAPRYMMRGYPTDSQEFQEMKQVFKKSKEQGASNYSISYADTLYLFTTWILGAEAGKTIKEFVDENGIKGFTPVYESCEKARFKISETDDLGLKLDSIEKVFEEIERCGYPKCREVFDILRKQEAAEKKTTKSDKTFKTFKFTDDNIRQ